MVAYVMVTFFKVSKNASFFPCPTGLTAYLRQIGVPAGIFEAKDSPGQGQPDWVWDRTYSP